MPTKRGTKFEVRQSTFAVNGAMGLGGPVYMASSSASVRNYGSATYVVCIL